MLGDVVILPLPFQKMQNVHTAETTRCLKSQVCQLFVGSQFRIYILKRVEFDYSESKNEIFEKSQWFDDFPYEFVVI